MKAEPDTNKRRKTEWQNAVKKLEGDTTLVKDSFKACVSCYSQEILDYLVIFTDTGSASTAESFAVHPLDALLDAFKDAETSKMTCEKLKAFLEECHRLQGQQLQVAMWPEACVQPRVVTRTSKDTGALLSGEKEYLAQHVPLDSVILTKPDDGLPCIGDWITCCISFIFSGSRLMREPIDFYVASASPSQDEPFLKVKKGFTRLQLVATDVRV